MTKQAKRAHATATQPHESARAAERHKRTARRSKATRARRRTSRLPSEVRPPPSSIILVHTGNPDALLACIAPTGPTVRIPIEPDCDTACVIKGFGTVTVIKPTELNSDTTLTVQVADQQVEITPGSRLRVYEDGTSKLVKPWKEERIDIRQLLVRLGLDPNLLTPADKARWPEAARRLCRRGKRFHLYTEWVDGSEKLRAVLVTSRFDEVDLLTLTRELLNFRAKTLGIEVDGLATIEFLDTYFAQPGNLDQAQGWIERTYGFKEDPSTDLGILVIELSPSATFQLPLGETEGLDDRLAPLAAIVQLIGWRPLEHLLPSGVQELLSVFLDPTGKSAARYLARNHGLRRYPGGDGETFTVSLSRLGGNNDIEVPLNRVATVAAADPSFARDANVVLGILQRLPACREFLPTMAVRCERLVPLAMTLAAQPSMEGDYLRFTPLAGGPPFLYPSGDLAVVTGSALGEALQFELGGPNHDPDPELRILGLLALEGEGWVFPADDRECDQEHNSREFWSLLLRTPHGRACTFYPVVRVGNKRPCVLPVTAIRLDEGLRILPARTTEQFRARTSTVNGHLVWLAVFKRPAELPPSDITFL